MGKTVVRITLPLLALVAIGVASGASRSQRQVDGFTVQLPQVAAPTQPTRPTQPTQVGRRHMQIEVGVPLTSRLEPGDKIVEVILEDGPLFVSLETDDPEETLANYLDYRPAMAIIKVTKKESMFTSLNGFNFPEIYSAEDWIKSTATAEVLNVLKDSTGRLVEGGLVEIEERGGEMVLDAGRRIIARYARTRSTTVGGTYLAVLAVDEEGRFQFDRESSVEFADGQTKRMRLDNKPSRSLETKTPEWVIQRARAIAERRKP